MRIWTACRNTRGYVAHSQSIQLMEVGLFSMTNKFRSACMLKIMIPTHTQKRRSRTRECENAKKSRPRRVLIDGLPYEHRDTALEARNKLSHPVAHYGIVNALNTWTPPNSSVEYSQSIQKDT